MNTTNNIRHTITTSDADGNPMKIAIRLNDECKNGHQDFAITATGWAKGKPKTDRNMIYGGCCHDDILKVRPDLLPFVRLHLADADGVPMFAIENGFYHLKNGFNSVKPDSADFPAKFCEEYRVTIEQFNELKHAKSTNQYFLGLERLNIPAQWKQDAENAIRLLEEMTGQKFVNDSKKSQYNKPSPEEITRELEQIESGYYTPEAEQSRESERMAGKIEDMTKDAEKKIQDIREELALKIQVLKTGGDRALKSCIFYTHSRQLCFNWSSEKLTPAEIDHIRENITMPDGVTITVK